MTAKNFFYFLAVSLLLFACQKQDVVSKTEATTSMRLLDVTTSAGQSGKTSVSKTAESFWLSDGLIYRCFHDHVDGWKNDMLTLGGNECEAFTRPSTIPSNSVILGINMGTGQKTQSIWDIGSNQMAICNHSNDWWNNGQIDTAESCEDWQRPETVGYNSRLASLNSGQSQNAESFWNNSDGTITQCQHKINSGFLGLGYHTFAEAVNCQTIFKPQILPIGDNFVLAGVTSDNNRPAETFWQDDNGILAQCRHKKESDGSFFATYHIGAATDCWYWRAPQ